MRDAMVARLAQLAEQDPRIMLITGDLGFGVLTGFAKRFPRQYLNVGVAEQNLIGIATGLALEGRICIAYSIGNFATLRCIEQIRNDVCYHGANVKIVGIGGGFSYGPLGMSHHTTEDLAILRSLPGMTVVSPSDKWEAGEAIEALIARPGPAYLRIDKSAAKTDDVREGGFALGRFRRVREGRHLAFVATGGIAQVALDAASLLQPQGIDCRVYSAHTLKPLDHQEIARAVVETGIVVTLEEHVLDAGLGSAVAESCLDQGLRPHAFLRLGLPSEFAPIIGSQDYLRKHYRLDAMSVAQSVSELLARHSGARASAKR